MIYLFSLKWQSIFNKLDCHTRLGLYAWTYIKCLSLTVLCFIYFVAVQISGDETSYCQPLYSHYVLNYMEVHCHWYLLAWHVVLINICRKLPHKPMKLAACLNCHSNCCVKKIIPLSIVHLGKANNSFWVMFSFEC